MLVAFSLLGAIAVGAGWVLQHRVIDPGIGGDPRQGLMALVHRPMWWWGIASMSVGQTLIGFALQKGAITLVAPLAATNLLWAFLIRAVLIRHRPPRRDLLAAAGFAIAVTVFVIIGGPKVSRSNQPAGLLISTAVTAGVAALATGLVILGIRRSAMVASVTAAIAAGVLYGLQDVATRGAIILSNRHGFASVVPTLWPYLLLAAATAAVLLTQRAFCAARLDHALPPMAATQPVLGVILGVLLLGDRLALDPGALAVEATCLALLIASTGLLARSGALGSIPRRRPGHRRHSPADQAGPSESRKDSSSQASRSCAIGVGIDSCGRFELRGRDRRREPAQGRGGGSDCGDCRDAEQAAADQRGDAGRGVGDQAGA
jgi:drug/metabolite transporter (DMT)-like permease